MARIGYLIDHVLALNTRTRMLLGEKFPFNEMARKLYDLTAPEYDYRKFGRIVGGIKPGSPGKRLRAGENPGVSEADFHPGGSAP